MEPLRIDFFHDVVCCWSFNISSRLRLLAGEMRLDIRHRTFVLQANRAEMAARWGSPAAARMTILGHWAVCRQASDRPELIDIDAMERADFDYPHGYLAALACKAAERLAGQDAHWAMFDQLQRAHITHAQNIADPEVIRQVARSIGFDKAGFAAAFEDPATAEAVEADRHYARRHQVQSVPTVIIRDTGTRLVNGPLDDLRAQIRAAQRLVA